MPQSVIINVSVIIGQRLTMIKKTGRKVIAVNRRARHDYFIEETYQAGICLLGTEVKSLREGRVNLKEANCGIRDGEVFLYNCHISPYSHGNINNHEPLRIRKLLLHKSQIRKLIGILKEKGMTLIPLQIYFERGRVKLDLGLCKGKKLYDKREDMKKKAAVREMQQHIKQNLR